MEDRKAAGNKKEGPEEAVWRVDGGRSHGKTLHNLRLKINKHILKENYDQ